MLKCKVHHQTHQNETLFYVLWFINEQLILLSYDAGFSCGCYLFIYLVVCLFKLISDRIVQPVMWLPKEAVC